MNEWQLRKDIELALKDFQHTPLQPSASNLFNTLGYSSRKTPPVPLRTAARFVELSNRAGGNMNTERALLDEWESIDLLFQLTGEEIEDIDRGRLFSSEVDMSIYECYLFFALKLRGTHYTRTQLAQIAREINKPQRMPPAMILFQHGEKLTFAVIDRRLHLRDPSRNVLEKVTLLKDIDFSSPSPAHIRILADLSRGKLYHRYEFTNFLGLHYAWKDTLNTEELNKRFYRELFNWFEWAISEATFPTTRDLKSEDHVIRLITRLLFVWFIKEKGLVADELFRKNKVTPLLKDYCDTGDSYYRAVLQNLFFGTLNTEIENRGFNTEAHANDQTFSRYCYEDEMTDPDTLRDWFVQTPFINGGLFDCLDREENDYIDCFGEDRREQLSIPNRLFFRKGEDGPQGLIPLLDSYKFTVEENTTIEEDVALDPELLGRVFENLLAAHNPETKESVRKQTGSYYTPREIVNYMTDESLVAYLKGALSAHSQQQGSSIGTTIPAIQQSLLGPPEPVQTEIGVIEDESLGEAQKSKIEKKIRNLLAYNDEPPQFTELETKSLMDAIDSLKVLDPAVGSGAFPMATLHKLTHILRRLDPDNRQWEQLQKKRATQKLQTALDISNQQDRDDELTKISDTFERYRDSDFGRKLYLIQNSIFGVDIQPIACQIAKLRFFITLAIEQTPDPTKDNMGIKPLPNLETRFITANTLIGLQVSEAQLLLEKDAIQQLQQELMTIREAHYLPSNQSQKQSLEVQDGIVRKRLEEELEKQRREWVEVQERAIDERANALPNNANRGRWREMAQRTFEERLQKFDSEFENVRKIISWKPYDQNATADFFEPEWMFCITEGFDVVIGNPPYKQVKKGTYSKQLFPYSEGKDKGKQNLYKLFVEQSYNLCKPNGLATLIVQSSLMCDLSSAATRQLLLEHTQLKHIIEFPKTAQSPEVQVFSAVTQGTCIYQFTKSLPNDEPIKISVGNDAHSIADLKFSTITKEAIMNWYPELRYFPYIRKGSVPILENIADDETINPLKHYIADSMQGDFNLTTHSSQFSRRPSAVRLLRGKHVNRFVVKYDKADEYCAEGFMVDKVAANRSGTFLICQQITGTVDPRRLHFALTEKPPIDFLWGNSVNKMLLREPAHSKTFLALLNSKFMDWYFRITSTNNHVQGYELERLPIPAMSDACREKLNNLAKQVMEAKETDPNDVCELKALEDEIDQIVYSLYGLTPNEIEIVKGNS